MLFSLQSDALCACSDRGMRLDCHHMLELEIPRQVVQGHWFRQKLRRVSPSCFRLLNEAAAVAIGDPEIARAIFLRKVKRKRGFWELTYTVAAQNGRLLEISSARLAASLNLQARHQIAKVWQHIFGSFPRINVAFSRQLWINIP